MHPNILHFLSWIREEPSNLLLKGYILGAIHYGAKAHFESWEISYVNNVMKARNHGISA